MIDVYAAADPFPPFDSGRRLTEELTGRKALVADALPSA
jgi:hypothetical protein